MHRLECGQRGPPGCRASTRVAGYMPADAMPLGCAPRRLAPGMGPWDGPLGFHTPGALLTCTRPNAAAPSPKTVRKAPNAARSAQGAHRARIGRALQAASGVARSSVASEEQRGYSKPWLLPWSHALACPSASLLAHLVWFE